MATTKKTTTRRAPRKTHRRHGRSTPATAKPSLATRTGKAIAKRPVASAAIATGAGVGHRRRGRRLLRLQEERQDLFRILGRYRDEREGLGGETETRVKDGLADAGTKAKDRVSKIRDGLDGEKSQAEIAEEALTLKETGKKTSTPTDPVVEQQSKVGAISY